VDGSPSGWVEKLKGVFKKQNQWCFDSINMSATSHLDPYACTYMCGAASDSESGSSDSEIDPDMPALCPPDGGCAVCDEMAEAVYLRDDEFILNKLDEPELVQPEDVLEEVAGVSP
jgi:hypothetical protein